jgi:HEAT repeat protein
MIKSSVLLFLTVFIVFLIHGNYCVTEEKADKEQQAEIEKLIIQLRDDDYKTREEAQKKLEDIGIPAEPAVKEATKSDDKEVSIRAGHILEVIAVNKRVTFSETFLKKYPDVYRTLAFSNSHKKVEFFRSIEEARDDKHKGIATNRDRANIVGELLLNNGEDLTYGEIEFIAQVGGNYPEHSLLRGKWYPIDSLPEAAPHIKKLLINKDYSIRMLIVEALGKIDDKKSIPEIRKLLKDKNTGVRSSAISALEGLGDKDSIHEIRKLINDENESVRGSAIMALGELEDKESIPKLRELLCNENDKSYHLIIKALGNLDDKESITKIRELIKTKDYGDFGYVMEALGKLGDKESIPEIRELFYSDDHRVTDADPYDPKRNKRKMSVALTRLGDKKIIPELRSMMDELSRNGFLSDFCIECLGELGDKESIPDIRKFLNNEYPSNRISAIFALTKLGDKESLPKIRGFLKSRARYEKIFAMEALGDCGDKDAVPEILKILEDKELFWDIRCWAAVTLLRLGEKINIEEHLRKDIDLLIKTDKDFAEKAKEVIKSPDIPSK